LIATLEPEARTATARRRATRGGGLRPLLEATGPRLARPHAALQLAPVSGPIVGLRVDVNPAAT
jgi:hypothetical protein